MAVNLRGKVLVVQVDTAQALVGTVPEARALDTVPEATAQVGKSRVARVVVATVQEASLLGKI